MEDSALGTRACLVGSFFIRLTDGNSTSEQHSATHTFGFALCFCSALFLYPDTDTDTGNPHTPKHAYASTQAHRAHTGIT